MKDKRLEVKLSVRGDGSLSRNHLRSSNRSNRSTDSGRSGGLPVSEIFALDRYGAPHKRPFDVVDRYRRVYPAQSLQALNQYDERDNGYRLQRSIPNIYEEEARFHEPGPSIRQYEPYSRRQEPYDGPRHQPYAGQHEPYSRQFGPGSVYATLPRNAQQRPLQNEGLYTLPARPGPRRVRISELQPTVYVCVSGATQVAPPGPTTIAASEDGSHALRTLLRLNEPHTDALPPYTSLPQGHTAHFAPWRPVHAWSDFTSSGPHTRPRSQYHFTPGDKH
ncbi:unnamed protein product [Plutella xylostella]|uniref:(diamondback moth) hypothetical protein n=1 Tax=Plutella xylostella TaxID=51655 RepID=A0A8S4G2L6_PLUXY|nr:unnamed protein product [Plutella xylostella]